MTRPPDSPTAFSLSLDGLPNKRQPAEKIDWPEVEVAELIGELKAHPTDQKKEYDGSQRGDPSAVVIVLAHQLPPTVTPGANVTKIQFLHKNGLYN